MSISSICKHIFNKTASQGHFFPLGKSLGKYLAPVFTISIDLKENAYKFFPNYFFYILPFSLLSSLIDKTKKQTKFQQSQLCSKLHNASP